VNAWCMLKLSAHESCTCTALNCTVALAHVHKRATVGTKQSTLIGRSARSCAFNARHRLVHNLIGARLWLRQAAIQGQRSQHMAGPCMALNCTSAETCRVVAWSFSTASTHSLPGVPCCAWGHSGHVGSCPCSRAQATTECTTGSISVSDQQTVAGS
jgi:hypothetical protein